MAMRRNQYSNPNVVQQQPAPAPLDLSVVLVTAGYDHEIRFWEAWSGICSRTIPRTGEAGVRPLHHPFTLLSCEVTSNTIASEPNRHFARVRPTPPSIFP